MVSEAQASARMTSSSCRFVSSSSSGRRRTAALWEVESTKNTNDRSYIHLARNRVSYGDYSVPKDRNIFNKKVVGSYTWLL